MAPIMSFIAGGAGIRASLLRPNIWVGLSHPTLSPAPQINGAGCVWDDTQEVFHVECTSKYVLVLHVTSPGITSYY